MNAASAEVLSREAFLDYRLHLWVDLPGGQPGLHEIDLFGVTTERAVAIARNHERIDGVLVELYLQLATPGDEPLFLRVELPGG